MDSGGNMIFEKSKLILFIVILTLLFAGSVSFFKPNQLMHAKESSFSASFTEFDSPGPSPTGLAWQGGVSAFIWNVDFENKKIYKIIPGDGNDVKNYNTPGNEPKGLAWDGESLWIADGQEDKIYRIHAENGTELYNISTPGTDPTGLTWDGEYLWIADDDDNKIYKINPTDGTILHSINSPGNNPTGLTWDGKYLWNADHDDEFIYMVNPTDGGVIYRINESGYGVWGLTWHKNTLWIAEDIGDQIYTINMNYDNEPPIANFTYTPLCPRPGDWVYFNANMSHDPDGYISYYGWDFDNDGKYDAVNEIHPYPYKWETPGNYPVTLTVIDNGTPVFMDTMIKIIKVCEEYPPTVTINTPTDGDIISGSVKIQGTANDTDGTIKKVEVKFDNSEWLPAMGADSWSYIWHTSLLDVEDGDHQISARSYNGVSYSNQSTINVTVNNHNPIYSFSISNEFGTLSINIKNKGDEIAENVSCSIDVFGGFFGLIHADTEVEIPIIEINQVEQVTIDERLFGIGPLDIDLIIEADNSDKITTTIDAFIIGFIII